MKRAEEQSGRHKLDFMRYAIMLEVSRTLAGEELNRKPAFGGFHLTFMILRMK